MHIQKYSSNIKRKKIKSSLIILALVVIFGGGYLVGHLNLLSRHRVPSPLAYAPEALQTSLNNNVNSNQKINFNLYWEVWNDLKMNYVDASKVTNQNLFYGSLKGMAAAVGDPYTVFMDPTEAKQFSNDLSGTFEGIGAEVGIRNDVITVIAPLDGTPAKAAGLQSGDKIYAVDGTSTLGMTINAVVHEIRGPKGTKVTLTIIRGNNKPQDIVITRSTITVKSVTTTLRPDGIFVIRVSNFNTDTSNLFKRAVNEALQKKPKGIILDLRDNPGGFLQTAVDMASEWIPAGPVVAEQFGGNRRNEYPSNGSARLSDIPTVVLVNGGSASASEIVAGALRDYKKAVLVGNQTFGKGSVQTLQNLSDGAELKVTIAKWLTPAGDFINGKGLTPTYKVDLTQDDLNNNRDPQINKAVQLLLKGSSEAATKSVSPSTSASIK